MNTNTEKGKRGFQSIPKEDRLTERVSAYLTKEESRKFKKYLKQHKISSTQCIRTLINNLI